MFVSGPIGTRVTSPAAAHDGVDDEVDGVPGRGPGRCRVPLDRLHLVRLMRGDRCPALGDRIEQGLPQAGVDPDVAPPQRLQHAAGELGPADCVAEHGGDAEQLDLPAHERVRERQRVVDVVPDVGVQDDLVHCALLSGGQTAKGGSIEFKKNKAPWAPFRTPRSRR